MTALASQSSLGERLLSDYAPALDSALILAISFEYDDGSPDGETAARSTLNALLVAAATVEPDIHINNLGNGHIVNGREDTSSSNSTGTTDEEEVERAFRDWAIQEKEDDSSSSNDDNLKDTLTDTMNTIDPISFLKSLFPKRDRIELDLAFQDAQEDIEVP